MNRATATNPEKVCPECGSRFVPPSNFKKQRVCSRRCYYQSRKVIRNCICAGCGHPFTANTPKQMYCSILCSNRHKSSGWDIRPTAGVKSAIELLESAPTCVSNVSLFFGQMTDDQLSRVWLATVVDLFGQEGDKGSLYRALEVVRSRLLRYDSQSGAGTDAPPLRLTDVG